jgi:hypothetical protein
MFVTEFIAPPYISNYCFPGVQVSTGKILDNDIAVFLVTFSTQEVLVFRNALTKEVAVGAEDKVEKCTYGAVITRVESELDNETTGGWKIIEVSSPSFLLKILLTSVVCLMTDG